MQVVEASRHVEQAVQANAEGHVVRLQEQVLVQRAAHVHREHDAKVKRCDDHTQKPVGHREGGKGCGC